MGRPIVWYHYICERCKKSFDTTGTSKRRNNKHVLCSSSCANKWNAVSRRGCAPWNKGQPCSEETKVKIGNANRGFHHSKETRNKMSYNFKSGKRETISYWLGKKQPEEMVKKRIRLGENHHNWNPDGISKQPGYKWAMESKRRAIKIGNGGSHTPQEWDIVRSNFYWTCPRCFRKEPDIKLTKDHIIPLSAGGSDYIENVQPLCLSCNCRKFTKQIRYDPVCP